MLAADPAPLTPTAAANPSSGPGKPDTGHTDGFKRVNDRYGHTVGGLLLVHVGQQPKILTRDQDSIARLGGDEFVVLCENTTAEETDIIDDRILTAQRVPVTLGTVTISVTASVGITAANHPYSATDLLHESDTAMYRVKSHGNVTRR
jgi:chemotaxis family two-component system sensor kinase Cph1